MESKGLFAKGKMDIPETKGDRRLVWGDCFNGDGVDTDFWTPKAWKVSDIDQHLGDDTCVYGDGKVHLFCYSKPETNSYVTPDFLTTEKKTEFRYGYFEIKARVPFYKGNSAAFWFCSSAKTPRGYGAEIDMVELLGSERRVISNLHQWGPVHNSFDGKFKSNERSHTFASEPEVLRTETHTYFMDWTPEYIDFGVDGKVYCHASLIEDGKENFMKEEVDLDTFRLPVHVIISEYLYTPGRKLGWGLKGDEGDFRYELAIDHVALYQRDGEELISL